MCDIDVWHVNKNAHFFFSQKIHQIIIFSVERQIEWMKYTKDAIEMLTQNHLSLGSHFFFFSSTLFSSINSFFLLSSSLFQTLNIQRNLLFANIHLKSQSFDKYSCSSLHFAVVGGHWCWCCCFSFCCCWFSLT